MFVSRWQHVLIRDNTRRKKNMNREKGGKSFERTSGKKKKERGQVERLHRVNIVIKITVQI